MERMVVLILLKGTRGGNRSEIHRQRRREKVQRYDKGVNRGKKGKSQHKRIKKE